MCKKNGKLYDIKMRLKCKVMDRMFMFLKILNFLYVFENVANWYVWDMTCVLVVTLKFSHADPGILSSFSKQYLLISDIWPILPWRITTYKRLWVVPSHQMIKAVRGMLAVASCLGIFSCPKFNKNSWRREEGGHRLSSTKIGSPVCQSLPTWRLCKELHRDTLRTVGLLSRQKVECLQCQYYIDQPAVCLTEL